MYCVRSYVYSSVVLRGKCCVVTWLVCGALWVVTRGRGYFRESRAGLGLSLGWTGVCVGVCRGRAALLRDTWVVAAASAKQGKVSRVG